MKFILRIMVISFFFFSEKNSQFEFFQVVEEGAVVSSSQLLLVQKSPHAKEAHPREAYTEPLQNQAENNKIK